MLHISIVSSYKRTCTIMIQKRIVRQKLQVFQWEGLSRREFITSRACARRVGTEFEHLEIWNYVGMRMCNL
jgi:hypothetical protein